MIKFTPNRKSLIIGILIGVAITILFFFIYLNLLSLSIILSSLFSALTCLSIAVIISIAIFFRYSFFKFYHYFKQSKIKIVIENAEFIAKGFDHSCASYQLKVSIMNKRRIICPYLDDVSIDIKDSEGNNPNLIKITKRIDEKTEITLEEEKMTKVCNCLFDKEDNLYDMKGLKLDDPYFMFYPCENSTPNLIGKKMNPAFNYSEYLLDLEDEKYSIDIKLKYIVKNEVIIVTNNFTKKPATFFTTTRNPELSALKLQNDGLRNRLGASENNLLNKEKEMEKLKLVKSEILKKEEDIRTLTNENNRLNAEIKRKEKGFEDQINEVNIKLKNCEEDLLKRPTKTVYVDRVK